MNETQTKRERERETTTKTIKSIDLFFKDFLEGKNILKLFTQLFFSLLNPLSYPFSL